MKECRVCKKIKKIECFVKSSTCKDGTRNTCKDCKKIKSHENYIKNIEKTREKKQTEDWKIRNRENAKNSYYRHRDIVNAKQRIKYYEQTEEEKLKTLERSRKYRKTEKAKNWQKAYKIKQSKRYFAMTTLNNAIRDGKLIRPEKCSICSSRDNIEGHHSDYDKPLEVIWVCRKCHCMIHKSLKEGKNESSRNK